MSRTTFRTTCVGKRRVLPSKAHVSNPGFWNTNAFDQLAFLVEDEEPGLREDFEAWGRVDVVLRLGATGLRIFFSHLRVSRYSNSGAKIGKSHDKQWTLIVG